MRSRSRSPPQLAPARGEINAGGPFLRPATVLSSGAVRFGTYHVLVERLLLWMGPGGVPHDLLVRSIRLFAEAVMPRFR